MIRNITQIILLVSAFSDKTALVHLIHFINVFAFKGVTNIHTLRVFVLILFAGACGFFSSVRPIIYFVHYLLPNNFFLYCF